MNASGCPFQISVTKPLEGRGTLRPDEGIMIEQELREASFHLAIREARQIIVEVRVVALDGQIPALVHQRQRIRRHRIEAAQEVAGDFLAGQVFQLIAVALQRFHKDGGGAGLEPIVLKTLVTECVQQTEWIVNACRLAAKVIAVIFFSAWHSIVLW